MTLGLISLGKAGYGRMPDWARLPEWREVTGKRFVIVSMYVAGEPTA
jgi:hypothetical protein